jgi:hypothetical protein
VLHHFGKLDVSLWATIVHCTHGVWRAGGKGKGQRAGNTIESWLSHSETGSGLWSKVRGAYAGASMFVLAVCRRNRYEPAHWQSIELGDHVVVQ